MVTIPASFVVRIPGPPVAKGRPRVSVMGGRVHSRTPAKTANWEQSAALEIRSAWGDRERLTGPVSVSIEAVFPRPKSKVWKRRPMPAEWKPNGSDIDNIAKAVCDACNRAEVWDDDRQVVRLVAEKRLAAGDELPCVVIELRPLSENEGP